MSSVPVAIALGSNLGDRRAHLRWAIEQLGRRLQHVRESSFIETDPVGVSEPQPAYLNAVVVGETDLEPAAVIEWLLTLERGRGRERASFRAARTLDLDLILYGDRVIDTPTLTVPHPRFRERAFVLDPLREIAPDWIDPVTGRTIRQLRDRPRRSAEA